MFRVVVAAAVILAAMILVKDRSILERTGLLSSCTAIAAPAGDFNNFWEACEPGKLEGRPNLVRRSCQSMRVVGRVEYWRCPAPIGTETTS